MCNHYRIRRLPSIIWLPPPEQEVDLEAQRPTSFANDREIVLLRERRWTAKAELALLLARRDNEPSNSPQHSVPATGPRTHAGGDSSASQEASSGSHASSSSHRHLDARRDPPPSPHRPYPPVSSPSRPAPRSSSSHLPPSATTQKGRKSD